MASTRSPRRLGTQSAIPNKAGKTFPRSALRKSEPAQAETSSDESNDEQDDEDNDDEEQDDTGSEPDVQALSSDYPFEFGDGSLTGTDDEMDYDMSNHREFEKSMELADAHAAGGAQESEDDDYNGIDAVSDDEDVLNEDLEVDILREAEKDLIAEFKETEQTHSQATTIMDQLDRERRSSLDGSEDDRSGLFQAYNMDEDPFDGASFMDETWGSLWGDAELGIWRKPNADNDLPEPRALRQKRVRFQDAAALSRVSTNSESESSDDEAAQFPDLLVDSADPRIQHLLAHDSETEWNGLSTNGSDLESVYDFEDDADRLAFEVDEDSSSGADVSSESDDDDETEDESVEEQQAKMQQFRKAMREATAASKLSTPKTEKSTPVSSAKSTSNRRFVTPNSKGPRTGTFVCDPTKATLTTDRSTRKTILYPPTQPSAQHKAFWERARSAVASTGSPRPAIAIPAQVRDDFEQPLTARATLASMFDGRMDVFEDRAPLEQFPRFAPSQMSSFSVADESDIEPEYPAEFSTMLNMDQFDDDSSDTEMVTPGMNLCDEPAFLAQGVVGSFRLNQHRARLESSLPANPAKRNAAAEHNALQSGRRAAGNAPITPARKRRSNSQDHRSSGIKKMTPLAFGSPLIARRRHSRGQSLSGRLDQTLTPEMWKKM